MDLIGVRMRIERLAAFLGVEVRATRPVRSPGPGAMVSHLMSTPQPNFALRLDRLRADLVGQGRRVQALMEASFDAVFTGDLAKARGAVAQDDTIDRVDVEIEKASVRLLTDATHENARLEPDQLRAVLTIVKVNNELERAADAATEIAARTEAIRAQGRAIPETFRVMANSIVGIMRDVVTAYQRSDVHLARVVLQSEDAVEAFHDAILRDAEQQIATGQMGVEFGFVLHELANQCVRAADYCTNIAEQVIYAHSGAIVRHLHGQWVDVPSAATG
jgi:phosphate transport system protein